MFKNMSRDALNVNKTKWTHPQKAPLNPILPVMGAMPFQMISMDFIMKLPESAGYDSILTIMDHDCTKMLITIPCRETITAEGVAKLFLQQILPRFRLLSKIISDRDPRFISKFMKELCHLMGITQNVSTVYHPRTDGQSERSNQWLEQYLEPVQQRQRGPALLHENSFCHMVEWGRMWPQSEPILIPGCTLQIEWILSFITTWPVWWSWLASCILLCH